MLHLQATLEYALVEKGFEWETQLRELAVDCEGIPRSLFHELGLGAIRKFSIRLHSYSVIILI